MKRISFYSILSVLIYCIAPAFAFAFVRPPLWLGIALLAVGLVYALVCLTVNCVATKKTMKNLLDTPLSAWQTHFDKRREEIQSDTAAEVKKLDRLLTKAFCYNLSLALAFLCLNCGAVVCMRATIPLDEEFNLAALIVISVLICVYLYLFAMPVVTTLFRKAQRVTKHDNRLPLAESEYPLLYGLAAQCAEATGFRGRYRLMLNDESGISVGEENGVAYLYLSPTLAPLLTREELYAVLIHEFAHVMHDDTALSEKYKNANYRYGEQKGYLKIVNCFFSYYRERIDHETDLFLSYSSLLREQKADAEVLRLADAQTYMDATAKSYLFGELFREPVLQFAYGIYAGEAAPNDYYKQKAEYYREHAREHYGHALEIMMRRLPAHNDSHPTFAMRAQTFGIREFDPFRYPEGDFLAEAEKYTAACDKELCHFLTMQWKEMHEENYVTVNEICERYEAAPETVCEAWKLMALSTYYAVDYNKAAPLAERLLQEDDNCNSARFYKGMIACVRDDESGLPLLLQAMRDDFNLAQAFDLYGECILRTGKQEMLDELRKLQAPFAQEIVDQLKKHYKEGFGIKTARLTAYPHDERYEEIARSVEDIAQTTLKHIYLCQTQNAEGLKKVYLLLPYPTDERSNKLANRLHHYFGLLWRKNEEYYVRYYKPNDIKMRRIKKLGAQIV